MPTEQNPLEYYHYYRASQRRVQQWVQKTSRELEAGSTAGDTRSSDLSPNDGNCEDGVIRSGSWSRRRESRRRSPSPSPQSSSKRDTSRSRGPSSRSRSTLKKPKMDNNDVRAHRNSSTQSRRKHHVSSDGLALLPFGLFPLIFALTPPSVATLFSATILLAGYFCVDYSKQDSISQNL